MSRLLRRAAWPAITALVSTAFGFCPVLQAQDSASRPPAPRDQGALPGRQEVATTLFLLVRITGENKRSIDEFETLMERGADKADCSFEKPADVRKISATLFREIQILTSNAEISVAAADEGPVQVRELPTGDTRWELRLAPDVGVLQELEVEYENAGKKQYKPQPSGTPTADLEMILRGTYALRTDSQHKPLKWKATVKRLGSAGAKTEVFEGKWPSVDDYYSIRLKDFRGDRQALFHTIKKPDDGSPAAVPNALDDVRLGQDTLIAIGSLGEKLDEPDTDVIDENIYLARAGGVPGQRVDRVWMLFPLTEEDCQTELERYRKLGIKNLLPSIDKASPSRHDPSAEGGLARLSASQPARWYELIRAGQDRSGRYNRQIQLGENVEDYRELQAKYPRAWRLLVWEFDDGSVREPQGVKANGGGRVYVLEQEIQAWPTALRKLTGVAARPGQSVEKNTAN